MNGLEFEDFDYQPEAGEIPVSPDTSSCIDYSVKIVSHLSSQMKDHNKANPTKKVSLSDLKDVYKRAFIKNKKDNVSPALWCLAKVNMFLRMKTGEIFCVNDQEEQGERKEVTSLTLEDSKASYQSHFDVTESWDPSQGDLSIAQKDIEEKGLDFDFVDVDNLYLDNYERLDLDWT